ncbi:MAG: hypothetical protein KDF57_07165, partial [Ottowia sp.]|nr:hypothetical protein [Ottowia sp.]
FLDVRIGGREDVHDVGGRRVMTAARVICGQGMAPKDCTGRPGADGVDSSSHPAESRHKMPSR